MHVNSNLICPSGTYWFWRLLRIYLDFLLKCDYTLSRENSTEQAILSHSWKHRDTLKLFFKPVLELNLNLNLNCKCLSWEERLQNHKNKNCLVPLIIWSCSQNMWRNSIRLILSVRWNFRWMVYHNKGQASPEILIMRWLEIQVTQFIEITFHDILSIPNFSPRVKFWPHGNARGRFHKG